LRKAATDLVLVISAVLALSCAGCFEKSYCLDCGAAGIPKVMLGAHSDAGTVAAQYPNPCEIDLDFGTVATGQEAAASIEIANLGGGPLDLSQVNPDLDPEFGLDYGVQEAIEPGAFDLFTVTFEPTEAGMVTSTFTIQTDGLNTECPSSGDVDSSLVVVLGGTGG
jgi:hypothetical protein